MKKRYILFFAGFLLVLNVFVWREVFILAERKNLEVDFLDVGQGDATFIETPEGHQILIDGGPSSAVLQKLAERMPFWDRSIDVVLLTHPEKDHMQGILGVLERYKVDYFLWTGVIKDDAENKKLAELLNKRQKPFAAKNIIVSADDKIKAGNVSIDILFPFSSLSEQMPKNANDTSVVSMVIFGKNRFLFTGDISDKVEKQLTNSDELVNIKSDVLKVAHHGSKYSTSEEFLTAVVPKAAVISCGKDNSYGHPAPEVLQRLADFDVETLRTDQKGDITMLSDGEKIKIQ